MNEFLCFKLFSFLILGAEGRVEWIEDKRREYYDEGRMGNYSKFISLRT